MAKAGRTVSATPPGRAAPPPAARRLSPTTAFSGWELAVQFTSNPGVIGGWLPPLMLGVETKL